MGKITHGETNGAANRSNRKMNFVDKLVLCPSERDSQVAGYQLGTFDHTKLWDGCRLSDDCIRNVVLVMEGRKRFCDFIENPLSWLICSKRLTNLLIDQAPSSFQVLECQIQDQQDLRLGEYRVLNVTKMLDLMDFEKSAYEIEEHEVSMVHEFVFRKDDLLLEKLAFRDVNFPYAVFFTRSLSLALRGITGFELLACKVAED